ncbi:MAG TPA: hypothetical protein VJC01_03970 [Candidatus Paceibacterota bacterium]
MIKFHTIINENPSWFTIERSLFKPYFLRKFCVDIQVWALEKMESDSLQNLENQQLRRMQKLVRHAYASVTYWNDLLNKAGIRPKDIKCIKDFQKIPHTTKVKFKTVPVKERVSSSIKSSRHYPLITSGSTGTPTPIVLDAWTAERRLATRDRGIRWVFGPRKKEDLYIRISPRNTLDTLYAGAGYMTFNAPDFDRIDMVKEKIYDICGKNNCIILSNPSIMFYLAQLAQRDKQTFSLEGIIMGGENILPSTKEYIKKIFQCPTASRYTCSEAGTLASECRYGNYHTNQDQYYVEVIDVDENIPIYEKAGKVIVTDFNNYVMPFIRYEIGDMGILYPNHRCKCGLLFPIIEFVGRDTATVKLPNGEDHLVWKILNPLTAAKKRPWILQFQMIRKSVYDFEILIVTTNEETRDDIDSIKKAMQRELGMDAKISIIKVPKINVSDGVKLRSYISLIVEK